ncbi:MAG: urea ABC transporter ATP-binding subunit UrtE [Opitutaceae bacterium]
MSALLRLDGVEADIGGSRILRGVGLLVDPGEVVCLMGRNGVGKTTTLRAIMGLRAIRAGSMAFDGSSLAGFGPAERAQAGLGYVPQGRDIFPHLTVGENLRLGLLLHRRSAKEQRQELERVHELFPILASMGSRKGGVLSGGQQQQLAIGRALLTRPRLLLLDEPTEGIQPSIIEQIGDTLQRLRREGLAILLVEQFVDFCREVGDRFYAMDRGTVTLSGPVSALTEDVVREHLQV